MANVPANIISYHIIYITDLCFKFNTGLKPAFKSHLSNSWLCKESLKKKRATFLTCTCITCAPPADSFDCVTFISHQDNTELQLSHTGFGLLQCNFHIRFLLLMVVISGEEHTVLYYWL